MSWCLGPQGGAAELRPPQRRSGCWASIPGHTLSPFPLPPQTSVNTPIFGNCCCLPGVWQGTVPDSVQGTYVPAQLPFTWPASASSI